MAANEIESPLTTITAAKRGREANCQRVGAGGAVLSESALIDPFDLIAYARKHRYRVRNIHDGAPVPPARKKNKSTTTGYVGVEDRADAIVGQRGFVTIENTGLDICCFFKSWRGVALAKAEIKALDGQVTQEGDCELAGWLPVASLGAALKLIRVSKLHPGNPNPPRPGKGLAVQKRRKDAVAVAGSRDAGIGG